MSNLLLPGLGGYAGRDALLGQWDTHPEVARALVKWAGVRRGDRVLESSAGIGNVVRAASEAGARVVAAEIDPDRALVLRRAAIDGAVVIVGDSLAMTLPEADVALINPPYEKDGETRHMLRALECAPRVCMIMRLVGLASERRAEAWRSVRLMRVAVLVPRPVFAGSSGMDEVCFVEVRCPGRDHQGTLVEWLDWRAVQGSTP